RSKSFWLRMVPIYFTDPDTKPMRSAQGFAEIRRASADEAPGRLGALGDADAGAGGDGVTGLGRQQDKGRGVERQAVMGDIDAKRLAQLAGPRAELALGHGAAPRLHH